MKSPSDGCDAPDCNLSLHKLYQYIPMYYDQGWPRFSKIGIEILDTKYMDLEYRNSRYRYLRFKYLDTRYPILEIKLVTGFFKKFIYTQFGIYLLSN